MGRESPLALRRLTRRRRLWRSRSERIEQNANSLHLVHDESESDFGPQYRNKNIRRHRHKVGVARTNALFLNHFFLQKLVSSHDSVWCGM